MIYNNKTWNLFKQQLVPGCTFEFKVNYSKLEMVKAILYELEGHLRAKFKRLNYDQAWDILGSGGEFSYNLMYNFCWPDGSPMNWQTYEKPIPLTKEQLVIQKCKSLDEKFKQGSLPLCKTKSLPFPEKEQTTKNKENYFWQYTTNELSYGISGTYITTGRIA